jgi:peptidoglycan/LPS O-acetylase OafA/YrhL
MTNASPYRPDIDGLRAVAIIPVIVFHLLPEWLPGGYLGVDVFFVISGYLITALLLREAARGGISLRRFWARRIRRIVPALVAMTAATLLVARACVFPGFRPAIAKQALATLGACANVFLWRSTGDYWGGHADDAPFLHMWSLGVEEQFYLLFPPLLLFLWRRARGALFPIFTALTVGSYAAFVVGLSVDPTATFYLLPTRAWEIGVGVCLATLMHDGRRSLVGSRWSEVLAGAGLAATGASYVFVTQMSPWVAVPVAGASLVIAGGEATAVGRLLSQPLLTWIGRLSYSLYLWHWPVFVLARLVVPGMSNVAVVLVTVTCAWVCHVAVEEPLRRRPGVIPAIAAAVVSVAALALWMLWGPIPRFDVAAFERASSSIRMYDLRPRPRPQTAAFRAVFADVETPSALAGPDSYAWDGIVCGAGDDDPAIVVFGDSHASMFAEALRTAADRLGRRVALFCMSGRDSPFMDIPIRRGLPTRTLSSEERYRFDLARLAAVERWRPRVVVVSARWSLCNDMGTSFLDHLDRLGVVVLLVEQPPELAGVGDNSVVQYLCWKGVVPAPGVDFLLPQGNRPRTEAGRDLVRRIAARHPNCRVVPLHDLFARGDDAVVLDGRTSIYLDDDHLTTQGTWLTLPRLTAALAEALDGPRPTSLPPFAARSVRGKSHPWPFSTPSTAGNAEGFLDRQSPHPAAAGLSHTLP